MSIFKKYKIIISTIAFLGLIVSSSAHALVDVFIDSGEVDLNPTSFSFGGDVVGAGTGFSMIPVWGVTATSLTNSAPSITPSADGSFSGSITGLTPNTTYYYQFVDAADNTIKLTTVDSFITPLVISDADDGKDAINLTGSSPGTSNPNCTNGDDSYCLLAPIPGISEVNPANTDLGDYLNIIIKFAIGFAGALAVIMMVLGGIQYMSTDALSGKSEGRERITYALGGLLLALASYLILNTINPNLVNLHLGIRAVDIAYEEEPYDPFGFKDDTGPLPVGAVAKCPEGIVNIETSGGNMYVCQRISTQVQAMINEAWSDGVKLSGGGFRTAAEQIALRAQNCGEENIYNQDAVCKPPTAYPGYSNHESGLAIDFRCDGVGMNSQSSPCFVWLANKSNNPTLINFSKEPWHWSVDGK
ncbi:MAG: D-alanyl-D-alanine carboxypeptidase family protein [Candidatus Pacebacteria bacterium]|nr:D-alanyl-D-alanine carboxypeptidase family protein [Candidatus Paceibacterota bacterium]MBP9772621.1 D-alanyl-D-alanine carboxypeptidase family protein [Candidatus Paceibacterota bacterium]